MKEELTAEFPLVRVWKDGKEYEIDKKRLDLIFSQPPKDIVEVVRCKECIHWEGTEQGGFYYFERCSLTGLDMIYDDFCSRGERKTE